MVGGEAEEMVAEVEEEAEGGPAALAAGEQGVEGRVQMRMAAARQGGVTAAMREGACLDVG